MLLNHKAARMDDGEVVTLRSHVHAWNVDGSSTDRLVEGSWIQHWETETGLTRGLCSYRGCRRQATHGGHVWIKRRGVCLTPICAACNSVSNVDRMQHTDGRHSELRAGITVVGMAYTRDMQESGRRLAARRRCVECGDDISDHPESHTLCRGCYGGQGRECVDCGSAIDNRPPSHTRCRQCFRRRVPRAHAKRF